MKSSGNQDDTGLSHEVGERSDLPIGLEVGRLDAEMTWKNVVVKERDLEDCYGRTTISARYTEDAGEVRGVLEPADREYSRPAGSEVCD